MKRPPGIRIAALMFLLFGVIFLIELAPSLFYWATQGVPKGDVILPFVAVLSTVFCFVVMAGLFSMRLWSRWAALLIAGFLAYTSYPLVTDGVLFDPFIYTIAPKDSLASNFRWIQMAVEKWVTVLLPIAIFYFLLFDRETVAAFRKLPAPEDRH